MPNCLSLRCFSGCAAALMLMAATPAPAQTQTGDATAPEPAYTLGTVVARLGDVSITLGEVIAFRKTLPQEFQTLPDEVLLESILSRMIDQTLLEQAARKAGLDKGTPVRLALRNQRRAVLAETYIADTLTREIDADAIAAAYEARYTSAPPVPEVRSSHILVEDKAHADELKGMLDAGSDFAALAARFSNDATAPRGGELGWVSYDDMIPAYADAVRGMATGELGGPVQTPFGWHLIRVDGKRDRPVPPLSEVEAELGAALAETARAETLARLREAAAIERLTDGLPAAAVRADALLTD